jgi:hypothetical protein
MTRFSVDDVELECVSSFRYLGRPIAASDSDWPALFRNLARARQKWASISRILRREGANGRVSGMFYKAVVMSVLLYGSESWVWTSSMVKAVEGFHNRVARRLSGSMPRRIDGQWVYPPIDEALESASLHPVLHYINVRRAKVWAQARERPIFELCTGTERQPGSPPGTLVWWDQELVEVIV